MPNSDEYLLKRVRQLDALLRAGEVKRTHLVSKELCRILERRTQAQAAWRERRGSRHGLVKRGAMAAATML
jgi:hypothetical protein